nr:hypothetical protein [Tanacetum cinerariifolium]
SGGRRGLKVKSSNALNIEVGKNGASPSASVDSGNVAKKVVSPFGVDECVAMEMQSFLMDTIGFGSNPPLPTQVTSSAGKFSYTNVTGKPSGKKLSIRTLFTLGGNGIDMVVPMESIRAISERFANMTYDDMLENGPWFIRNNPLILKKWHPYEYLLKKDVRTVPVWVKLHGVPITAFSEDDLNAIATKLGTPLMLDSYTYNMCMQSWGWSIYARVMIELRADLELKDNIVVAMPKIKREGHYICNVRVEYGWRPPRCASCKVFGHIHEECLKNTSAGEKETLMKPSQTSRGILVGLKMGFKPRQEYRPVPKKTTASSSGNKKRGVRYQWRDYQLVNNDATSSESSFMDIDNNSIGTTPIMDKIAKFENLVIVGQAILLDKAGNPLKKIVYSGDHDSEDEVASVDNDMARDLASEKTGFVNQSLQEQWRDSYGNSDYDEYPYDDDMYEGQNLS